MRKLWHGNGQDGDDFTFWGKLEGAIDPRLEVLVRAKVLSQALIPIPILSWHC
ncbi:hypothetical protein ACJ2PR_07665 [Phormidesmis sp. 146-33]